MTMPGLIEQPTKGAVSSILDSESFKSVYESYREGVYYTAYRICQHEADAQEIVSETFMKAYEHRHQFAGKAAVSTWLYRIAYNASIDLVKRKRREVNWDDNCEQMPEISSAIDNLVENMSREQQLRQLHQAMKELSPEDRAILGLRFDRGLSYEEIATVTEIPASTIGTRIFRAKKQLLKIMQEGGQAR